MDRLTDWSQVGLTHPIFTPAVIVKIEDFGGAGDSSTINNQALADAMNWLGEEGGTILFGQGTYLFDQGILLGDSIVLCGQGSDKTIIRFNAPASGDLIQMRGTTGNLFYTVSESTLRGQSFLIISENKNIAVGNYLRISMDDSTWVTSDWALGTVGQIVRVTQVQGDTIRIDNALRLDLPLSAHPRVCVINPRVNAGIECLRIDRRTNDLFQSSTVLMEYAANCHITGVESDRYNFAHVTLSASTHCTVRNSFFHDAFSFGGGGKGYGVMIQNTSGDCLVENNVFKKLRHSMILQAGANGNVFGYNYSTEPYWTEVSLPANAAGDMVLHGNYVFSNLFEGNIGQQIVIDDSHGMNGPYNTFFRNRLELYGIFMNSNPATNEVNIVGNEVTNTGFTYGLYLITGTNQFLYGNNIRGAINPGGTGDLPDTSCYLKRKPGFLSANFSFPTIGMPNGFNTGTIPAKLHLETGKPAYCAEDSLIVSNKPIANLEQLVFWPNPATHRINISNLQCSSGAEVMIIAPDGSVILQRNTGTNDNSIDISALVPGVYFIRLVNTNKVFSGRMIKL